MLRVTYGVLLLISIAAGPPMALADDPVDDAHASEAGVPTLAEPQESADKHGTDEAIDGEASEHPPAGDDGHHGHDLTDLSHANPGPQLHDPSELRFDLAICTFLVFVALLALLRVVAWTPILNGLNQREQSIVSNIENAHRKSEEAEEKLRQYEAKLAGAGVESQAIIAQARKDAEAIAERIREEAKADAARQRDRAIADIQAARNNAVRDVAQQGADLAVSLAGRIVRRELKPEDHTLLITEALERFPSKN